MSCLNRSLLTIDRLKLPFCFHSTQALLVLLLVIGLKLIPHHLTCTNSTPIDLAHGIVNSASTESRLAWSVLCSISTTTLVFILLFVEQATTSPDGDVRHAALNHTPFPITVFSTCQ